MPTAVTCGNRKTLEKDSVPLLCLGAAKAKATYNQVPVFVFSLAPQKCALAPRPARVLFLTSALNPIKGGCTCTKGKAGDPSGRHL